MKIIDGVAVWGNADDRTLAQMHRVVTTGPVWGGALMADNHLGYSMPIGGVVAYNNAVSPSGVGYDISCGIMAVRTNIHIADIAFSLPSIADEMARQLTFGVGRTSGENVDNALFDDPLWNQDEMATLKPMAQQQLGTIGSGNHFVDLLTDADGMVWIMCHFGSRGFGHKTASGFLNLAAGRGFFDRAPGENMDNPPTILMLDTYVGQYYWEAMNMAGRYAYAGREYVIQQVLDILGANTTDMVHNHHNFAWKEMHDGADLIVVRKGATPAFPGQRGAVGGSMGDISVILRGADSSGAYLGFYSAMHGAGRVMSRTAAAGKVKWLAPEGGGKKRPVRVGAGAVSREMMDEWIGNRGVILRGGGVDESPHVYRRLPDVLAEHQDDIEIEHVLNPVVVIMAGADVTDPYKD